MSRFILKLSGFLCALCSYFHQYDAVVRDSPETLMKEEATGKISYICAMYRPRDLTFDDAEMPDILTFCTCALVSESWLITARLCYVQEEWLVSLVTEPFTDKLPPENNRYMIKEVQNHLHFSLVQVNKYVKRHAPIKMAASHLSNDKTCTIYSFTTPDMKPIPVDNQGAILYKIWHMRGGVYGTKVKALEYKKCIEKHVGTFLNPFHQHINESTLCIDVFENNKFEPCSFDRGAPIICENKLQGILVYERELPKEIPKYLPTGCYGNIDWTYSIFAASLTAESFSWANYQSRQPIAGRGDDEPFERSFADVRQPRVKMLNLLLTCVLFLS